jgi:virginiamycin A acetyltransferase
MISKYVPRPLVWYFRKKYVQIKYPKCKIKTNNIHSNVMLGVNCSIEKNVVIRSGVTIGDFSYINPGSYIGEGTKIGKYCSISYDCKIGVSEHPINFVSSHPATYGSNNIFREKIDFEQKDSPIIGNDVWIGANSIILRGVIVGDGAIIAAGAIVTKDVLPYTIVGGIPAKVIKNRYDEEIVEYLLKWKWWNLSTVELQKYKNIFCSREDWQSKIKEK